MFSGSFKVYLAFPKKCFCICRATFAFLSLAPTFNCSEGWIYISGMFQNKFIGNSNIERNSSLSFKV